MRFSLLAFLLSAAAFPFGLIACSSTDTSAPSTTPPAGTEQPGPDPTSTTEQPPTKPPVAAKPGDLDTSWGTAGTQLIPGGTGALGKMILAPSGELFVSGGTSTQNAYVARLGKTGALDAAFGTAGVAQPKRVADSKAYGEVRAIAISGTRVFAAVSSSDTGAAQGVGVRVLALKASDGSLDTTFATAGATVDPISAEHYSFTPGALAALDDGKVVVGGYGSISIGYGDAALMRFQTNGAIDPAFTKLVYPGTSTTARAIIDAHVTALIPLAGGNVLLVGTRQVDDPGNGKDHAEQMLAVRGAASNGPTFPGGGRINDAVKAKDGSVYAFVDVEEGGYVSPSVMHLTAAGAIDTAFGQGGYREIAATCFADRGAMLPDGKMIVVGACDDDKVGLMRLGADGKLDTTFGTKGVAKLDLLGVGGIAVQADGKVLVLGSTKPGHAVVRVVM